MIRKAVFNSYYDELVVIMKDAATHGAECYIYSDKDANCGNLWGLILTERGNIIYIQRDTFEFRGWTFTLKYQPSKEHGQGCQCLEEPLQTVTYEDILHAEQEGLQFTKRLRAKLYLDGRKNLSKMWGFDKMEQIT